MSTKLAEGAKLPFYDGPVTNGKVREAVAELMRTMQLGPYGEGVLSAACEKIRGHSSGVRRGTFITTSDGYEWFYGASFTVASGRFVILIPWSRDKEERDGNFLDRSVAVYTAGRIPAEKIVETVKKLITRLKSEIDQFIKVLEMDRVPRDI